MGDENKTFPVNVDFFEDLTGDISTAEQSPVQEVGERIRQIREEKGLPLDELSNLTGFDVELLSKIEKNEVQPQLGTVIKLQGP